ncbi:MAG TPA: methionine adenosyltransferase [Bacteroidetes bacterium]|nr:S-adenosylmethionine synthase [bacterium BMS3Bbin04]HDO65408.1 methionine adenosyltransferase [Bacteroidota bacterium]HEX04533.1 methionine adenosyltransferase [Bacteroidota bacterium]
MGDFVFSSESVTEGHPDKVADQISDAILDAILGEDPFGRVAAETFVTTGLCLVGGEITTETYVDIATIARNVIRDIGYVHSDIGFDADTCSVLTSIDQQATDIALGVDRAGAGDQGMMFGYACTETKELMPMPISLAHKFTRKLADVRKSGEIPWLRPDGKVQVSVRYEDDRPVEITTVVLSTQHAPDVKQADVEEAVWEKVIKPVLPDGMYDEKTLVKHINPTGRFVQGGPKADAGLTGRKIIVDTYGGYSPHGGGAFSGKDPTKVDRSGAYIARWAAKNVVAAGLAERCQIQVAYAIGVAEPVSLYVTTYGTGKIPEAEISALLGKEVDWTPAGAIDTLNLRRPIYRKTASYGHFGRENEGFPWEDVSSLAPLLQSSLK